MTKRGLRRLIIVAACLVLIAGGLGGAYFARQWFRDQQASAAREKGLAAFKASRFAEAIPELGTALGRRPDDPECLLAIARCFIATATEERGNIAKSVAYAVRASTLRPQDPEPLAILLEAYGAMRRWTEALATADKLLAITPKDRAALETRLAALTQLGKRPEALEAAKALVAAFPDETSSHVLLLLTMRDNGATGPALLDYAKEQLTRRPDDQRFRLLVAQVAAGADDLNVAVETASALADTKPKNVEVFQGLISLIGSLRTSPAISQEQAGRLTTAFDALVSDALAAAGDSPRLAVIAPRLWLSGRASEVTSQLAATLSDTKAPDSVLGLAALAAADADGAADTVKPAIEALKARATPVAKSWVATIEAQRLLRAQKLPEALDQFRQAVADDSGNGIAAFLLAQTKSAMGDAREAERLMRTVISSNPGATLARVRLASMLLDRGETEAARDAALAALRSNTRAGDAAILFAEATIRLGESGGDKRNLPQVRDMLKEMLAQSRESGDVNALLARAHFAQGEKTQAEEVVRRIQSDKISVPSVQMLALVRAAKAANSPTAASLSTQLEQSATDPVLVAGRAAILAESGDVAGGRALIAQAAAAAPDQKLAWQRIEAIFLDQVGAPEAADKLRDLARDQASDPVSLQIVLDSRASWRDKAIIESSLRALQQILGETSPVCRVFDARRFIAFDRDASKAAGIVRQLGQVTEADPTNVLAFVLQAEAMLVGSSTDLREPIKLMSRAIDAAPTSPRHYPRLLQLLQASGDSTELGRRLTQFSALTDLPTDSLQIRAEAELALGALPDAIRDYRQLVDRGVETAKYGLATALLRSGRKADALKLAQELAAQSSAEAKAGAARLYAQVGEADRALKLVDELPQDVPVATRDQIRLDTLVALGRSEEALTLLKSRAERENTAEAWLAVARFSLSRRDAKSAQQAIDAGLRIDPQNAEFKRLASAGKLFAGEKLGRAGIEEVALSLVGQSEAPGMTDLLSAIQAYNAEPKLPAFIDKLVAITRQRPTLLPAWQSLMSAQMQAGRVDDAMGSARSAMAIFPTSVAIPRLAAMMLMQAGRPADATGFARQWRARVPNGDPFEADVLLADAQLATGRSDDALQSIEPYFDRIAGGDGGSAALEVLSVALADRGQLPRAQGLLWTRAGKSPDDAIVAVRLAGRAKADTAALAQWLERVEPVLPPGGNARYQLAEAWLRLGAVSSNRRYLDRAKTAAEAAAEDPALRGAASFTAASALMAQRRQGEAVRFLTAASKELPGRPDVLMALAQATLDSGGPSADALTAARAALAATGGDSSREATAARVVLGRALIAAGQFETAQTTYAEALKAAPADPLPLSGLLVALHEQGKQPEFDAALRAAVSPQARLNALMQAAIDFEARKRPADAERFYRLAVESSPNDPMALNNIAYLLLKSPDKLAQAVGYAEKALAAAEAAKLPAEALTAIADTLAVGYRKQHRPADAERICTQSRKRDPKSALPLIGLAECAIDRGDRPAAERFLAEIPADLALDDETAARLATVRASSPPTPPNK